LLFPGDEQAEQAVAKHVGGLKPQRFGWRTIDHWRVLPRLLGWLRKRFLNGKEDDVVF
jgi:hypothetical protein